MAPDPPGSPLPFSQRGGASSYQKPGRMRYEIAPQPPKCGGKHPCFILQPKYNPVYERAAKASVRSAGSRLPWGTQVSASGASRFSTLPQADEWVRTLSSMGCDSPGCFERRSQILVLRRSEKRCASIDPSFQAVQACAFSGQVSKPSVRWYPPPLSILCFQGLVRDYRYNFRKINAF